MYSKQKNPIGRLEMICGPMFSGKTEELIRRVKRAYIAHRKVQIFRPSIDKRYHTIDVISHTGISIPAIPVEKEDDILKHLSGDDNTHVVAIDEIQFFATNIIDVINHLIAEGIRVICSGLDQDYLGKPFGVVPDLLALADQVDKIQAVCTICGEPAGKTYRLDKKRSNKFWWEKKTFIRPDVVFIGIPMAIPNLVRNS